MEIISPEMTGFMVAFRQILRYFFPAKNPFRPTKIPLSENAVKIVKKRKKDLQESGKYSIM
jgi:hypothetical protein